MASQSDYPDSWDDDCPSKGIKVEVGVYDVPATRLTTFEDLSFDWIEIPTSGVELWESKSNGPHIKKTAKVVFPTEWDGASVRELVGGYGIDSPTYMRLWVKDENGRWVLNHFGIANGVGATENSLESKVWVYDMSYLFEGITVTQTYSFPTADQVIRDMAERLRDNLVPLTGVVVLLPNSERLFLRSTSQLDDGLMSPRSGSSYYGHDLSERDNVLGDTSIDELSVGSPPSGGSMPFEDLLETSRDITNPVELADRIAAETFGVEDGPVGMLSQRVVDWLYESKWLGNKEFTSNHDTVADVMNWLSSKTGIQYHFEPTAEGTALVITGGPMRRTFVQDSVVTDLIRGDIEPQQFQTNSEYRAHETVTVRDNNALFEIAPANAVIVKGDTRRSLLEGNISIDGFAESAPKFFEDTEYPVAIARAEPLYEAAGDSELPLVVESDATTTSEARQEAIVTLQDHLDQTSEGDITLDGMPRALPYDVIDAYETCNRFVTEQIPVRYEIDEVKHTDSMTSTLQTELNVQAFVGEEQIAVNTETRSIEGPDANE